MSAQISTRNGLVALLVSLTIVLLAFILVKQNSGVLNDVFEPESEESAEIMQEAEVSAEDISSFESAEDFKDFISQAESSLNQYYYSGTLVKTMAADTDDVAFEESIEYSQGSGESVERYSETNVQVAGIDEPDIVKTNGEDIFLSSYGSYWWPVWDEYYYKSDNNGEVKIIEAFPVEDLALGESIEGAGNLLLKDDVLAVLSSSAIHAYDVSEETPVLLWEKKIEDKSYIDSARLIADKIYLVTKTYISEYDPCPIKIFEDGEEIACTSIYHPQTPFYADITYNTSIIDIDSGEVEKNVSFVASSSESTVYMSSENLFLTYVFEEDYTDFVFDFVSYKCSDLFSSSVIEKLEKIRGYDISGTSKMTEFAIITEKYLYSLGSDEQLRIENELSNRMDDYYAQNGKKLKRTGIVKIDIDDLSIDALGEVYGTLLNQFSLDEYNGNLRAATTTGGWMGSYIGTQETGNELYVLDSDLNIIGSVESFGEDETIYSVRFIQDKGYVVTYKQIDPFFVMDLSNPSDPQIVGELEIPGYSSYLHPLDENIILGVGEEDNKVKLSLFDVSDPSNPVELSKYKLDEYYSEISQTHHAFLQDSDNQIFFIPGSNGAYIFSYSDNNLKLKKAVGEIYPRRAIYINNYLYILSESKIVVLDESTWDRVEEIEL